MTELTLLEALRLSLFTMLPCLAGLLLGRVCLPIPNQPGVRALHLGLALIFGPLLAAPSLHLVDWLGWPLSFMPALAGLLLITTSTVFAAGLCARFMGPIPLMRPMAAGPPLVNPRTERWLLALLLGLIILRLGSLLPDLLLRPVFPWDAWKTWAWKARTWFELGELIQFAPGREWLSAPAGMQVIDGVNHPDAVSLLMLWSAIALGRWDDSMLGIPWLLCGLGMGLALYGLLRLHGLPRALALASVYVMLSLPMLSTHIVLFGYADLWMAGLFTSLGVALVLWLRLPDWRFLGLILLSMITMALIKDTGSYWIPVILATLVARYIPTRWLAALAGIGILIGVILFVLGIDPITLLTAERVRLDPRPMLDAASGMGRHLFVWLDWHLLGWLLLPLVIAAGLSGKNSPEIRGLLVLVLLSLLALALAFSLTRAAQYAIVGTLFSRMLLQVVPVIILLAGLVIWDWLRPPIRHPDE